jgi:putative transcriptional regulator
MQERSVRLRLPELRARLNRMTQSELAKQAGLSKTSISNLESSRLKRIELSSIARLCRALKCAPNDLFELPDQSETDIVQRQHAALSNLLNSLKYDVDPVPDRLDKELNDLVVDVGNAKSSVRKGKRAR